MKESGVPRRESAPRWPGLRLQSPRPPRRTPGILIEPRASLRVAEQNERRPEVRVLERAGRLGPVAVRTAALGAAVAAGQVLRQAADLVGRLAAQPVLG